MSRAPNAKQQRAALDRYEKFTGHRGKVVGTMEVPELRDGDTLVAIGRCEAIAYCTTREGKRQSYQHEFKPSARPVLAVSHDGKRLYLLAGAYRFTDRGIEDR
jgi:hypothetical protein